MKIILCCLLLIASLQLIAQRSLPVTDSLPAEFGGLKAGFSITGASEKEVGNKGNFSRYKLRFYITNVSPSAIILMAKPGFFTGTASPELIIFNCLNATGARFTNKQATLRMQPCILEAMVDEKDCATGKIAQVKKSANVGYWIKPGETISTNTIMIVPLNEKPNVVANFYPTSGSLMATPVIADGSTNQNGNGSFSHIKNFSTNNYLHIQNGPLSCTGIDMGWWSAQWEFVAVPGTNNFFIRNRWKPTLMLSTDNGSLISDNTSSANSMWTIEESSIANVFYIKNVSNGAKLALQGAALRTIPAMSTDVSAQWIIEQ